MMTLMGLGLVISFVGWVMILIAAFRASALWGLGILIGPFVIYAIFRNNLWVNVILGIALIGAFAAQHWDTVRTAFIMYIVGYALSLPGQMEMLKRMERPTETVQAEATKQPRPQALAPQPYTPPPAAVAPPTQTVDRTPRAPSRERPSVYMATTVTRVYVHNLTKKYYPLDCAARPDAAYRMAKSLAIEQGFKLAEECAK